MNKLEKYKNFCPVPWRQFASTTEGFQRACCTMTLRKDELRTLGYSREQLDACKDLEDGMFIFDQGQRLKAKDGIETYINSDSIKNIKKMFASNIAPHQCRCYYTEKIYPDSRRLSYLGKYGINKDSDVERFLNEAHDIDYYDIRLGNVCNLQCLMCGSGFSNQLYEESLHRARSDHAVIDGGLEIRRVDGKIVFDKDLEKEIFDWANDDFFNNLERRVVEDLKQNPNKLITFYMIGGEPLLNAPHLRFLERLVELGISKNIRLEYNTNLTVVTDSIIELWSKFNYMTMAISIDDIEDRYEYVRYPAKWSKILTNLEAMSQAIKKYPDVFGTVNVVAVINFFTAYKFHELEETVKKFGIETSKIISTGPVHTTPALLTKEEKEDYIKLIKQDTAHYQELVSYVRSFEYSESAREEFNHMLKFWDSNRRKTFADVFPELATILK